MKLFFLLISCLMIGYNVAQVQSDTLDVNTIKDKECRKAIRIFEDSLTKWFYKVYSPKMNVKLSCASCSRFSIQVAVQIDENGNPSVVTALTSYYCGKSLSEKQKKYFISGIKKLKFAPCMKGKLLRYTFQRALMC